MTRRQLFAFAYRSARDAGLDGNTSDAVARRVVERIDSRGDGYDPDDRDDIVRDEIVKHAQS